MANWHYYDANNYKIGPIRGRELKALAERGTITPNTRVEDEQGRTAFAKDVKGLTFYGAEQPQTTPPKAKPVSENPSSIVTPLPPPAPPTPTVPVPPVPPPAPKQLFCTNCGSTVSEQAVACMSCGAKPTGHKKFCRQCGVGLNAEQVVCVKCGAKIGGSFDINNFDTNSFLWAASPDTKRCQLLMHIIAGGLMVLLFFTPMLVMSNPGMAYLLIIWGWNSWFGFVMLILGGVILGGKLAEYRSNTNAFPPLLYWGLFGIVAFCLLIGTYIACASGHGTWAYNPHLGRTVWLGGAWGAWTRLAPFTVLVGFFVAVSALLLPFTSRLSTKALWIAFGVPLLLLPVPYFGHLAAFVPIFGLPALARGVDRIIEKKEQGGA